MSPITTIPALAGFLCGISFYPVLSFWSYALQRKAALKRDRQRLKNTTFILSGKISDFKLVSHIHSLCNLDRQGVLHVEDGRRKGYILFRNGAIIDGFFRNRDGIDGVREIFSLVEGDYFFESRQILQPNLVRKSIDTLLQEVNHNEQPNGEGKHHER